MSEHASLVALLRSLPEDESWSSISAEVLSNGSALATWEARQATRCTLFDPAGARDEFDHAVEDLHEWSAQGWNFVGLTDSDFPSRLRDIHQVPPFLFYRGKLDHAERAVAVVGSRAATTETSECTGEVARLLVQRGLTVLSGLALGVDAAAHRSALDAGGRTVAVIGTGIARHYPPPHVTLQQEIAGRGLVLSQFWPDAPPRRHQFIMRNAVMSGFGHATVVMQAAETSGARAQARMGIEHGRPVILHQQVVYANQWARKLVGRPGVFVGGTARELLDHVDAVLDHQRRTSSLVGELIGSTG